MSSVLEIMSRSAYRRGSYPVDTGQLPGGYAYGGYMLLRSEYRRDPDPAKPRTWLRAIADVLMADTMAWTLLPATPGTAEVPVYSMWHNGDVIREDLELFAVVLRRYLSYGHEVTRIQKTEFLVTLESEGAPPEDELAEQVSAALNAHFNTIPFGDDEQYGVIRWTVDPIDPEISPSYQERE